jgi:putative FmdB family regulatory protein
MPIYEYRRPDGTTFEILQSFSDEPLTTDPETGVPVERVLHAPAVHFKGKGFYQTDYGTRKRQRETEGAGGDSGAAGGDSEGAGGDSEGAGGDSKDSSKERPAIDRGGSSKDGAGGEPSSAPPPVAREKKAKQGSKPAAAKG